jgi:hypothetical protein
MQSSGAFRDENARFAVDALFILNALLAASQCNDDTQA